MHQPVHCESHSSRDRDRETTWRSLILSAVFCFCRCGAGLRQANVTARDRYIDECCHATTHDILRECIVVPHRRSGFPPSTLTRRIDRSATDEPHAGKPHSRRVTEKIIRPPTHRRETFPSNRFLSRYLNFVSGGFQHILFRCPLFHSWKSRGISRVERSLRNDFVHLARFAELGYIFFFSFPASD